MTARFGLVVATIREARLVGENVRQMAGFALHAMLSKRWVTLSLRDVARLVGGDVRWVMASFVIVSLEGRCSVRWMVAVFIDGHWRPFFAAAR